MRRAVTSLAGLILTASLVSAAPAPAGQSDPEKSKTHFAQGVALFQEENYEAALIEFRAAYDANPNYKLLFNIGVTLQALHRFAEAERTLEEYLVEGEGELPDAKLEEARQILDELEGVVGELVFEANVDGAAVLLDGERVDVTPVEEPMRVSIGHYDVTFSADGYEDVVVGVDVAGGETVTVRADLVAVAASGPHMHPAWFFTSLGFTVAAGVSMAVTGGLALDKEDRFLQIDRSDEDRWRPIQDEGERLVLATNVLLGVTCAFAAASVVLGVLTYRRIEPEERAAVLPMLVPGGAGVVSRWRF